jgi:hypothetical protein
MVVVKSVVVRHPDRRVIIDLGDWPTPRPGGRLFNSNDAFGLFQLQKRLCTARYPRSDLCNNHFG